MELITARVQNFRSVEDSGEFSTEHSTCLVGKNEAGKTAILQALAGLNPHPATPFEYNKERDYPKRFLARYDDRHPEEAAVVVTTEWKLSDAVIAELQEEFGEDAVTGDTVTVSRGYDYKTPHWRLPISVADAIQFIINNANLSAPEKSQLRAPTSEQQLIDTITPLAAENTKFQGILEKLQGYPSQRIASKARSICQPYLPQFMYFSSYDRMSATVHLPSLKTRADNQTLFSDKSLRGDRLFWEFLEFSGVTLNEILEAGTFESFNSRLRAASNALTDEILEYWTQNPDIEVEVKVDQGKPNDPAPFNSGAVGRARIYNRLHRADTSFSERSAGFTWFFSFLIKFDRVKQEADGSVFLLLDEPGLTLHGKAQADLLRFFEEKLEPYHQIMYSTHSPFMVPPDNLMSARIVEDLVETDERGRRTPTGSQVRENILGKDRDSVFPLQAALGYSITQSLFVGKHTVLVEGPSDILYLKALSAELANRQRVSLDARWVLCPSGGLDNIKAFVSLFAGNELDVIALTDYSKKDAKKLERLKASEILKAGGVLSIADFVDQEEADVEDLFEASLLCEIINSSYALAPEHAATPEKLASANPNTGRLVKQAESHFNLLPDTIPTFDHFAPSSWLIANPDALSGEDEQVTKTLDRAEALFLEMNKLIST